MVLEWDRVAHIHSDCLRCHSFVAVVVVGADYKVAEGLQPVFFLTFRGEWTSLSGRV